MPCAPSGNRRARRPAVASSRQNNAKSSNKSHESGQCRRNNSHRKLYRRTSMGGMTLCIRTSDCTRLSAHDAPGVDRVQSGTEHRPPRRRRRDARACDRGRRRTVTARRRPPARPRRPDPAQICAQRRCVRVLRRPRLSHTGRGVPHEPGLAVHSVVVEPAIDLDCVTNRPEST